MRKLIQNKIFIRCFAAAIAFLMLFFCCIAPVLAVEEDTLNEITSSKKEEETEKAKEPVNPERKTGQKPILGAGETAVLVDSVSGRILFESDGGKKMYPASTTKIMTALLAIEAVERGELSMDTEVTITSDVLDANDPDGSNIALKEGEVISLENLLKGLMIPSGNDAACAIAICVSGSIDAFVDKMNVRAAELGAADTHFANPHGLHDDDHYTTAADMAKIACAAMKLDKFRNIADIAHVKIPPTNMTETERYYINTNGLLSAMRYSNFFFKGTIGIKTGYTGKAGNCLVSAAVRDGVELIGVVFGGKEVTDSHNDSIEMLEWGFENHISTVALSKGDMPCEIKVKQGRGSDSLTLSALTSINVVVHKDADLSAIELRPDIPESVYAPINAGDYIGEVAVLLDGAEIGRGQLIASREVKRSFFWPVMALGEWLWGIRAVRIIVYTIGGIIVGFAALFIIGIYRNIKIARRRRQARLNRRR